MSHWKIYLYLIVILDLLFISTVQTNRRRISPQRIRLLVINLDASLKTDSGSNNNNLINTKLQDLIRIGTKKFLLELKTKTLLFKKKISPNNLLKKLCRCLERFKVNSVILVGGNAAIPLHIVKYIMHTTASLGLPTMTWMPYHIGVVKPDKDMLSLNLEPGLFHVAQAVYDFLETYNWKTVVLLVSRRIPGSMDFAEEMKRVSLAKTKTDSPTSNSFRLEISKFILYPGITGNNEIMQIRNVMFLKVLRNCLLNILASNNRIIVLHGFKLDLGIFYKVAKMYNLTRIFGADYVWIMTPTSMPSKDFKILLNSKADLSLRVKFFGRSGVAGLFGLGNMAYKQKFLDDIRNSYYLWSESLKHHLTNMNKQNITDKNAYYPKIKCKTWTNNDAWIYGKYLYKSIKSMKLSKKKQIIQFDDDGYLNGTTFEIFNSKFNTKIKQYKWWKVGRWMSPRRERDPSNIVMEGVTWPGMANKPPLGRPKRYKLKVATLPEPPFVIYGKPQKDRSCDGNAIRCRVKISSYLAQNSDEQGKLTQESLIHTVNGTNMTYACCAGMTMDLLRELMKDLQFDVDLFEIPDSPHKSKSPEHGSNILIHSLLENTADMVVTSFKITPNRTALIDFSVPFQEAGIGILIKLREGAISPTAFLRPYDRSSWCVIFIFSVHSCGTAIFIYEWLSPQGLDRGNIPPREHRFSLFRSLWLIWSMLFGAAVNTDNPRGVASRFLASIWALFALVFLASYTANLAAFMISKEEFYDLEGINDWRLVNPENHKPNFRFSTIPNSATEENIGINFPKMVRYMKRFNISSVEEAQKALDAHEIDAFVYDANVLDYKAATDKECKLRVVGRLFAMTGYGIGLPKGSKMLNKFNTRIMNYQRSGKLQRWKQFWMSGACKKTRELANTNKMLGVKNFISAFILLLGGMILSFILLICEHCFYRYMRPRIRNWDKYGCCGLVSLSMGQLLSFEQSVNQTVDLVKHFRCRNPVCENRAGRLQSIVEISELKIKKLEQEIEYLIKYIGDRKSAQVNMEGDFDNVHFNQYAEDIDDADVDKEVTGNEDVCYVVKRSISQISLEQTTTQPLISIPTTSLNNPSTPDTTIQRGSNNSNPNQIVSSQNSIASPHLQTFNEEQHKHKDDHINVQISQMDTKHEDNKNNNNDDDDKTLVLENSKILPSNQRRKTESEIINMKQKIKQNDKNDPKLKLKKTPYSHMCDEIVARESSL